MSYMVFHKVIYFVYVSRFRMFCHWLCNHSYFGNIILACIMISSALLTAEDPINSRSYRNQVIYTSIHKWNSKIKTFTFCLGPSDFWLLLHCHFYGGVIFENGILWFYSTWRCVPSISVQSSGFGRRLRFFDIHLFQVRICDISNSIFICAITEINLVFSIDYYIMNRFYFNIFLLRIFIIWYQKNKSYWIVYSLDL